MDSKIDTPELVEVTESRKLARTPSYKNSHSMYPKHIVDSNLEDPSLHMDSRVMLNKA